MAKNIKKKESEPGTKQICVECGKRKVCVASWGYSGKFSPTCWDCIEDQDDGFVVRLN